MKKIAIILTAFLFVSSVLSAQECKSKGQHAPGKKQEAPFKQLDLTPAQEKQMETIRQDFRTKMEALNKNESLTVKESRDRRYAMQQEKKAKMMALLTPDQKTKLEVLKKQRQDEHQQQAERKLEKMQSRLSLSNEQVEKIRAYRQGLHNERKAIMENEKLSRTEKETKLAALKEKNKQGIRQFLTPDQQKKFDEKKKDKADKKDS